MAVCPFCLPCPRTSVTVMPEMCSFSSDAFTSSTLLGRMIDLISFMRASLQDALQGGGHVALGLRRQLLTVTGEVEHVDRLVALGRYQDEVDVASELRH